MIDMKKFREYVAARYKFLSKYVNGLIRSKRKYLESWTEKDTLELVKANMRKKEIGTIYQILRKDSGHDLDNLIEKNKSR